jgi:hypothetical protein
MFKRKNTRSKLIHELSRKISEILLENKYFVDSKRVILFCFSFLLVLVVCVFGGLPVFARYSSYTRITVTILPGIDTGIPIKVMLEGPYDNVAQTMKTGLFNKGLIPLSDPYSRTKYPQKTDTTVTAIPADVVDWVLVELRDETTPTTIKAQKVGFLKKDGMIVEPDGSSNIKLPLGRAFVVIRHRNHLVMMSKTAVDIQSGMTTFDMTVAANIKNTAISAKDIGGKMTMKAGDIDQSQTINATDRNTASLFFAFANKYQAEDVNMDGFGNASDRNFVSLQTAAAITIP